MLRTIWKEWIVPLLIAVILTLVLRTYVVEARQIPSESMEPTLKISDIICIDKLFFRISKLERGDIIVFWPPVETEFPYVKRLVGLPGETIEIREGKVLIDGCEIDEPYAQAWWGNYGPVVIPEGALFFMGDNRGSSADSREWGFAEADRVIGKVFSVVWPFSRIRFGMSR